jgi:hypothetical protein
MPEVRPNFPDMRFAIFERDISQLTSPRTMATGTSRPEFGHANTIISSCLAPLNKRQKKGGREIEHPIDENRLAVGSATSGGARSDQLSLFFVEHL